MQFNFLQNDLTRIEAKIKTLNEGRISRIVTENEPCNMAPRKDLSRRFMTERESRYNLYTSLCICVILHLFTQAKEIIIYKSFKHRLDSCIRAIFKKRLQNNEKSKADSFFFNWRQFRYRYLFIDWNPFNKYLSI